MTAATFAGLLLVPIVAGILVAAALQRWVWTFAGVLVVAAVVLLEGWPAGWLYPFGVASLVMIGSESMLFHHPQRTEGRPEQERIP